MITKEKGYRNSNFLGSNVIDLQEILWYEIGDMKNCDILDFMNKNYGTKFDFHVKLEDYYFENYTKELMQEILDGAMDSIIAENYATFVNEILNVLENKLGTRKLFGLWLTTKNGVKMRYCKSESNFIDEYQIPNKVIPISDLCLDGALFVYTQNPNNFILGSEIYNI